MGTYFNELSAAKARDCAVLFLKEWTESRGQITTVKAYKNNFPAANYCRLLDTLRRETAFLKIEKFETVVRFVREKLMEELLQE